MSPKLLVGGERLSEQHQSKRAEIARATRAVVADRGVDGASMRIIAREAGYTTGVITHYFANKEHLLEYALEHAFAGIEADLEGLTEAEDVLDALKTATLHYMPVNEQNRKSWAVWQSYLSRADESPRISNIIQRVHAAVRAIVTQLIRKGQVTGYVTKHYTAEELSDQWGAILNGLTCLAAFEQEPLDEDLLAQKLDLQITYIRV